MSEKQSKNIEVKAQSAEKFERSTPEMLARFEVKAEKRQQSDNERSARKELNTAHEATEQEHPLELIADDDQANQTARITRDDKQRAYRHTMKHVQSKLGKTSRSFSKVIHTPAIEKTSEVLEKTIARPAALLGAAMFATVGLGVMSFFARRNGFALSGAELVLFISVGWLAGIVIEFAWRKIFKKS